MSPGEFSSPSAFITKVFHLPPKYLLNCSQTSALLKAPSSDGTAKGMTILGSFDAKAEAVSWGLSEEIARKCQQMAC